MLNRTDVRQGMVRYWVPGDRLVQAATNEKGEIVQTTLRQRMAVVQRRLLLSARRKGLRLYRVGPGELVIVQFPPVMKRLLNKEHRLLCEFAVGPNLSKLGGPMPPEGRVTAEELRERMSAARELSGIGTSSKRALVTTRKRRLSKKARRT